MEASRSATLPRLLQYPPPPPPCPHFSRSERLRSSRPPFQAACGSCAGNPDVAGYQPELPILTLGYSSLSLVLTYSFCSLFPYPTSEMT
jgi:hypothetical protein